MSTTATTARDPKPGSVAYARMRRAQRRNVAYRSRRERELTYKPVPDVLFHIAPQSARQSIARFGLLPSRPTVDGRYTPEGEWGYECPYLMDQPRGVYAERVIRSRKWGRHQYAVDWWAFTTAGLKIVPDGQVLSGLVVLERVPPTRLAIISRQMVDAEERAHRSLHERAHEALL